LKHLSICLLACALPVAALGAPESYVLDPAHTIPNFSISHFGMSTVYGRFERATGKIVLDRAAKTGSVDVRIPAATISSGDSKRADGTRSRDEHLRSADFFNVAEFPDLVFKSTKVNFAGDKIESVEGNLTILGVSKPVKLTATTFACGPNPFSKKEMCGADLVGSLKRTEFGLKFGVPAISDEVKLMIAVEAYKE
jgi:polyisoprenoid-binding protein YceI